MSAINDKDVKDILSLLLIHRNSMYLYKKIKTVNDPIVKSYSTDRIEKYCGNHTKNNKYWI